MSACSEVQSDVIPNGKLSASVKSLLSVLTLKCNPTGVLQMECHERYFMVAVDLSFIGEELRFEAVGKHETNGQYVSCYTGWVFCHALISFF